MPDVTFFDLSNPAHLNQLFGKLNQIQNESSESERN